MNIDKFAEEMVISQVNKELSQYCLDNWDAMLEVMPNSHGDMDTLIELAVGVGMTRDALALESYSVFIEKLKKHQN